MGIEVDSVTRVFDGRTVLKDVSLSIDEGTFFTVLGRMDAGKTTLLRIMCGIETPTKGRILYDGKDVTNLSVQKRSVAMVYQQFVNYPSMTIYENIASPLRVSRSKYTEAQIDSKVKENAEMLGLTHVLKHYPEEVSGGQQQRTAIARALVKEARFTFLDEPLANLDYKLREELRGELKNILRQKGGVVVYATPDPVDALSMATHVGYLEDGEMLQYGLLDNVYNNPACVEAGRYFSYPAMNLFESVIETENGNVFLKIADDLKVDVTAYRNKLDKQDYIIGTRAYDLFTVKKRENFLSIKGEIDFSEELGSDTEVYINYKDLSLVILIREFSRKPSGAPIEVFMNPERLFIFEKESRKLIVNTAENQ